MRPGLLLGISRRMATALSIVIGLSIVLGLPLTLASPAMAAPSDSAPNDELPSDAGTVVDLEEEDGEVIEPEEVVDPDEIAREGEGDAFELKEGERPSSLCVLDRGRQLLNFSGIHYRSYRRWTPCHGADAYPISFEEFYEFVDRPDLFRADRRRSATRTGLTITSFVLFLGAGPGLIAWGILEESAPQIYIGASVMLGGIALNVFAANYNPYPISPDEAGALAAEYNARQGGGAEPVSLRMRPREDRQQLAFQDARGARRWMVPIWAARF